MILIFKKNGDTKRKFVLRRKIWRLFEDSVKNDSTHILIFTGTVVKLVPLLRFTGPFSKELC